MLKRRLYRDDLVRAGRTTRETEQELNLSDGRVHERRGGVVDGLVALDDLGVLARDERGGGGLECAGDVGLEGGVVGAEEVRDVGVGGCGVDEGEEGGGLAVWLKGVYVSYVKGLWCV